LIWTMKQSLPSGPLHNNKRGPKTKHEELLKNSTFARHTHGGLKLPAGLCWPGIEAFSSRWYSLRALTCLPGGTQYRPL
jgi:hypothetical protein